MKKKLLVVGQLGYHEETIVIPILQRLKIQYDYEITRIGGSLDFFVPEKYSEKYKDYLSSIIDFKELVDYDAVFFVDYWNPLLPLYQMGSHFYNKDLKFIGLCHGSVLIEGDVATDILCGNDYEEYLNKIYDLILVPRQFLLDLLGNEFNMKLAPFPMDIALNQTPEFKYNRRVIYAHRYDYDKGNDIFEEFVQYCKNYSKEDIEFIVIGNASVDQVKRMQALGILYMGYMSFNQQMELCKQGGYAWASVRSELMAYAVWHLMSFGLTPLINNHPAYDSFPARFKYETMEYATWIINEERVMQTAEWHTLSLTEMNNTNNICELISDELCVA